MTRAAILLISFCCAAVASTSVERLQCEPLVYFLLGMSAHKSPGAWEFFYPSEAAPAAAYDKVARVVADRLGFTAEVEGQPRGSSEAWRGRFITFIEQYYSRTYTEDGNAGLILDTGRLFQDAKRSPSLDAYLAGAYARYGSENRFRVMAPWKAQSVATLIKRRTEAGVITRTFMGYIPGGTDIEFKETEVVRRIFDSWRTFVSSPHQSMSLLSLPAIQGVFTVRVGGQGVSGSALGEVYHSVSYDLDAAEVGFVHGGSSGRDGEEVDIALYDRQRGIAVVEATLKRLGLAGSSTIIQNAMSEVPTPSATPVPNQSMEPTATAGRPPAEQEPRQP